MVMKTYFKDIIRSFKKNISRFISITLIVLIGSIFASGLGTLTYTLEKSLSDDFVRHQGADIILKKLDARGFLDSEVTDIKKDSNISGLRMVTCIDIETNRIIVTDMAKNDFHTLDIIRGKPIDGKNQILLDRITPKTPANINFFNEEFEVVGIVKNPSFYTKTDELNNEELPIEHYYYLDKDYLSPNLNLPITDLYLTLKFDFNHFIFSSLYQEKVDQIKVELEEKYNVMALTYEESVSYNLVTSYSKKINVLCFIFPIFFLVVSTLVFLSTMTRLIEEERSQMGCYRSIGFGTSKILFKYLALFCLLGLLGAFIGLLIGLYGIPHLLYNVFNTIYFLPKMAPDRKAVLGIVSLIITSVLIIVIGVLVILKELATNPCELLKPKAFKAGKKIFLEKITFFWKRLKFKYKSTLRNIFRHKKNLIMTVIAVAGSTALVLAGLGLYQIASGKNVGIPDSMVDSFAAISAVLILFAGTLCMLVIYNLTNMNIGSRQREIASLKVLGYQNIEVGFYIYREILIMTLMGVVLGLPLGYGILCFIIDSVEFGSHHDVTFISYFSTVLLVNAFVILIDLVLYHRILKIDMNDSLKTNE